MRVPTWGLALLLVLCVGNPRGLLAQDSSELWDLAIFEKPPHLLQIEDAPQRNQLLVSRRRTDEAVKLANATFRQKAGSLWLQANLEYQAFLSAASEADRRDTGAAAAQRVRQFREVMLGASSANMTAEWTEALVFANSIEGTVQPYVPADVAGADDLVRGLLFDLLNTAEGQGSNATTTIQDLTSGSIKKIERLAMSAIAARVQAATVLQLAYGQSPARVRTPIRTRRNE